MKHLFLFLLLAGVITAGTARADISFGLIAPLSGQYAAFGEQIKRGATQAVADINAGGGLLGQQVKLEVADDGCDPKQAVAAANQMVSRGVKFVIGHYCSGSAIPASKVFADEEVLMVTPRRHQPHADGGRRQDHLPRLRARRPSGGDRGRRDRKGIRGQTHRHPAR